MTAPGQLNVLDLVWDLVNTRTLTRLASSPTPLAARRVRWLLLHVSAPRCVIEFIGCGLS